MQATSVHDRVAYLGFTVAAPGTVGHGRVSGQITLSYYQRGGSFLQAVRSHDV